MWRHVQEAVESRLDSESGNRESNIKKAIHQLTGDLDASHQVMGGHSLHNIIIIFLLKTAYAQLFINLFKFEFFTH